MAHRSQRYEIVTVDTKVNVFGPASFTVCKQVAKGMNIKGRPISVYVQPVKKEIQK